VVLNNSIFLSRGVIVLLGMGKWKKDTKNSIQLKRRGKREGRCLGAVEGVLKMEGTV